MKPTTKICSVLFAVVLALAALTALAQQKKPNVVMLMSDDTGWADLGVYLGGAALTSGAVRCGNAAPAFALPATV